MKLNYSDAGDYAIRLCVGHAGEHREGQAAAGIRVGYGIACAVDFQGRQARLAMDRHRVMQTGLDAVLAQESPQLLALPGKDHIKMIDVFEIHDPRQGQWQAGETGVVAMSDGSALFGSGV